MTIRILLADDHTMFREALRIPIELEADMQVVAEAGSGAEVFTQLAAVGTDVLVLDIGLPDMNGIEVAQRVAREYPEVRIVVLTGYTDRIFVEETMKTGARAFVVKSSGSHELILAIRAVVSGQVFLSPRVTESMVSHVTGSQRVAPPVTVLGKRELEILRLVADGRTSPEIAAALGITSGTVDVHRRNIKQKLGLNTMAELIRYAIREGLISTK